MRNSIIDLVGGTFVITAISYATGIAFYNSFFRNLNANPNLFSVSLDKVLFEGGRTLLNLAFTPVCILLLAVIIFIIAKSALAKFNQNLTTQINNFFSSPSISTLVTGGGWSATFIATAIIASYSFNTAIKEGQDYAESTSCTRASVKLEDDLIVGCVVYKSDTETWLLTKSEYHNALISIPTEKYSKLTIYIK